VDDDDDRWEQGWSVSELGRSGGGGSFHRSGLQQSGGSSCLGTLQSGGFCCSPCCRHFLSPGFFFLFLIVRFSLARFLSCTLLRVVCVYKSFIAELGLERERNERDGFGNYDCSVNFLVEVLLFFQSTNLHQFWNIRFRVTFSHQGGNWSVASSV
jgi:hypothetical protein